MERKATFQTGKVIDKNDIENKQYWPPELATSADTNEIVRICPVIELAAVIAVVDPST